MIDARDYSKNICNTNVFIYFDQLTTFQKEVIYNVVENSLLEDHNRFICVVKNEKITANQIIDILQKNKVYLNKSKTRKRPVVIDRYIVIYFLRMHTTMTHNEIGRLCELDHSSCIHAIKTINNLMFSDRSFRDKIDDLNQCFV